MIDSLVVSLDLDPKKFGSGAQAAQKKLTEFNAAVKKLGIDETKLTEQQRKRVNALRETEVQTARTGKELKSTETITKSLFSTFDKMALGVGGAIGAWGLKEMVTQSIEAGAAISRLSKTLGLSTTVADTWGKAIRESVHGSAGSMLGTLQGVSDELNNWQNGGKIDRLNMIVGILARYNGGKRIPLMDQSGKARSADDLVLDMANPVQAMGPQKAHAFLSGLLPDDVINFMLLGRGGMQSALSKAAPNAITDKQAADDARVESETAKLADAFDKLKTVVLGIAAPEIIAGLKATVAWLNYLRDPSAPNAAKIRDDAIAAGNAMAHATADDPDGSKWAAQQSYATRKAALVQGIETALPLVRDPTFRSTANRPPNYGYGQAVPHWSDDDKVERLQQLILSGMTPQAAAAALNDEMARGLPPVHLAAPGKPGGAATSLLDAIRSVESGGRTGLVSSAGALGPYQLMPGTAAQYGVKDPTNEGQARAGAAAYLADLLAHYGGDLSKALGAYNWGPARLDRDIAAHGSQWAKFLPAETAAYIPRVMAAMGAGAAGAGGTTVIQQNGPVTIQTAATDAQGIAKAWHKGVVAAASGGPS